MNLRMYLCQNEMAANMHYMLVTRASGLINTEQHLWYQIDIPIQHVRTQDNFLSSGTRPRQSFMGRHHILTQMLGVRQSSL